MLTKVKKTLRYSLIWKEKNVVELNLKKKKKKKRAKTGSREMQLEGGKFREVKRDRKGGGAVILGLYGHHYNK